MIAVENLEKTYVAEDVVTPALRGVSFSIAKGEFVAIMGPSGSGKSTLLHMLGFLDRQTGGIYRFEGKIMDDYTEEEIARVRNRKMGFVFQSFNLLPRTTVFDNVQLPLLYSETAPSHWAAIVKKTIALVGLAHREHHESSKLSGGEKQRVAIARALVMNPQVLFADEPTGNLDSVSGGQVMAFLDELHRMGHTILLITHETYTAEYAERIIRLRDGVIESDTRVEHRRTATSLFKK
ncbi:ABC transporter ATP-binding protein [Candidatus Uhrbacteria bacterium]|nr:ABC transporter ATP-binding protein [Candidatus Uhrbacteria bacterium]